MADALDQNTTPLRSNTAEADRIRQPTAAAGTLARDANEVKATPVGWIRERRAGRQRGAARGQDCGTEDHDPCRH
jgi:hypothetical protein